MKSLGLCVLCGFIAVVFQYIWWICLT